MATPLKFLVQSWASDGMPLTLFGCVEASSEQAAAQKLGLKPKSLEMWGEEERGYGHKKLGGVVFLTALREVGSLDELIQIEEKRKR